MPTCTRCKTEKPEADFYRYYSRRGCPLNGRCKECCREVSKAFDRLHNRPSTASKHPGKSYSGNVNPIAALFLKLKRPVLDAQTES